MLKEITDLSQTSNDLRRRWFSDENLNLYVWQGNSDDISEFQISFQVNEDELVLTWNKDSGLSAYKVDSGAGHPAKMKSSPILTREMLFNIDHVRDLFTDSGKKLEHDLYEFIMTHLDVNPD